MKPERSSSSPKVIFFILTGLFLVLFLLYNIGRILYEKHSFQILFEDLQAENTRLEGENKDLEKQVILRQTKEYLDRFAKENFDLLNPGEKRIVLPVETPSLDGKKLKALPPSLLLKELEKKKPIREQWWDVFFGER